MHKPSVSVEGVSKKFGLTLKSSLKYGLLDGARRMIGRRVDHQLRSGEFWALEDVSFSLEPGDALGIMGVNGSGKTTLLRILNGTYSPDAGKVILRGRIGALIAAGAGFSPMLSGRENIFISGALLGMAPQEIRAKFDEIVDFAELGEFIDMPVRNYSSGMSVRLGFAIAVIGTPDVLLVDEVLAVGDISFQKKCFERINQMRQEGTTILLVSHAPGAIWAVCNKGLSLHQGHTSGLMPVEDACQEYENNNMRSRAKHVEHKRLLDLELIPKEYGGSFGGVGSVLVKQVETLNENGQPISETEYGESFIIRCYIDSSVQIDEAMLRVQVDSEINKAISIIDSYEMHKKFLCIGKGRHLIDIKVMHPNLRPGVYSFGASIIKRDVGVHLFFAHDQARLIIKNTPKIFFYADFRASVHLNICYQNVIWEGE